MKTLGIVTRLVACTTTFVLLSDSAAFANNVTAGSAITIGTWTDATDNLCAETKASGAPARARIRPVSGDGPIFRVIDEVPDGNPVCTGNLSIPEDAYYEMTVSYERYDPTRWETVQVVNFYT